MTLGGNNQVGGNNEYTPLDTVTSSELLTNGYMSSQQQPTYDMRHAKNNLLQEPYLMSGNSEVTHQVENIAPNMHIVEERSNEVSQDFQ